ADPSETSEIEIATAQVLETWKGKPVRQLRYNVSSTFVCDISSAKQGETVVLFLRRYEDSSLSITHAGRGRLPIREIQQKRYVGFFPDVILPHEWGTKREERMPKTFKELTRQRIQENSRPAPRDEWELYSRKLELAKLRDFVCGA